MSYFIVTERVNPDMPEVTTSGEDAGFPQNGAQTRPTRGVYLGNRIDICDVKLSRPFSREPRERGFQ